MESFTVLRTLQPGSSLRSRVRLVALRERTAVCKDYRPIHLASKMLLPLLVRHEVSVLRRLEGVEGVPGLLGKPGRFHFLMEWMGPDNARYKSAKELPSGFFMELGELLDRVRAHSVLHLDVGRNVVVSEDGSPGLVDFAGAVSVGFLPLPLQRYLCRLRATYDRRSIAKLKKRVDPSLLTAADVHALESKAPFEGIARSGQHWINWSVRWLSRQLP